MNASFRKQLLWLHTWTGLTVGLAVVFLALTGAGFVLRPQLEDLVYGKLHVVPACAAPLPLDQLAARAKAVHPQGKLYAIEFTTEDTASVAVQFTGKDYVYMDPCQGTVLGVQNEYGGFFGVMDWLHRFRFFSDLKLGRTVAGWVSAFFLVVLLAGGIALWWPRNRQALKAALKFNAKAPGSARTLSLHKVVGVYSAIFLFVITITGLPIGFEPVKEAMYRATGYVPPGKPLSKPAALGAQQLPMEAFWQKTRQLVPNLDWVSLRYPAKPDAAFEAEILEKGRPHELAKGYHYMDAYSGETLRLDSYAADQQLGRKIYLYCIALHAGMIWGLPYQLLLFVAVLGVGVQAYSGFSPYLRRKLRRPAPSRLKLVLVKKTMEAEGIASFEFADPQGGLLPPFTAGAHLEVFLPGGTVRHYSLCNNPRERHRYVVAVLLHAHSRGGSRAMHALNEGEVVEFSLPRNHFALAPQPQRAVLVAGGIGITPLLAMAEQLAEQGADFTLHYCARAPQRAAFLQRLVAAPFARRVQFHYSDGPQPRRFDAADALARPDAASHVYVCGPVHFMDEVFEVALRQGWQVENLHREYFAGETFDAQRNTAFDVKLARSGRVIHVAKEQTVAAALCQSGVEVATSCAEGVCGTCLTTVLAGEPEHRDRFLTAKERAAQDRFTPCCSRARGPLLVLDM
jgi:vanillate O-demethylase ferredoxin subunit